MIVRGPREDRFTILNRRVVNDPRLSFRALGLLTFLLDKPDDWRVESTELARGEGREGRDAVRSALTELEHAGYLRREKKRRADGTFYTEAVVYDAPTESSTGAGEPGPGNPAPDHQAPLVSTENDDGIESDAPVPGDADASPGPTRRPDGPVAASKAERDEVYQAVVAACGMEYGEMTTRQRKACAVAAAELCAVGATVEEVHRRASIYPQKYHVVLTPNALANQWAALRVEGGPPQARGESVMDRAKALMDAQRPARLRVVGDE